MRVMLAVLVVLALLGGPVSAATRVKGYFRKDGTYVSPHYRSDPDGATEAPSAPLSYEDLIARCNDHRQNGELAEAERAVELALGLRATAEAYEIRGIIRSATKRPRSAKLDLERSIRMRIGKEPILMTAVSMAMVEADLGDFKKARAWLGAAKSELTSLESLTGKSFPTQRRIMEMSDKAIDNAERGAE